MRPTLRRATASTAVAVMLAALALPAVAQSPSAPASPALVASPAPPVSPGAAPSGYTWTVLPAPAGTEDDYLSASGVAADGTWAALAYGDGSKENRTVWHVGPTDTEVELDRIPKSSAAAPRILIRVGDQLLVVGSGTTWSPADGTDWTPAKNKLKGVGLDAHSASDGTRSLLIGRPQDSNDQILYSTTDGMAFAKQAKLKAPEGKPLFMGPIALSPTGGVVVSAMDLDEIPYLWASPDGVTFTPATLPFEAERGNDVRGLAATPTGLVMVASLNSGPVAVYTSPDGQTWTETFEARSTAEGASIVTLPASSGGGLAMVGNGYLYTSPDGVTWTETPTPELEGIGQVYTASVLPDGRIVLAVGVLDQVKQDTVPTVLVGTPLP